MDFWEIIDRAAEPFWWWRNVIFGYIQQAAYIMVEYKEEPEFWFWWEGRDFHQKVFLTSFVVLVPLLLFIVLATAPTIGH